MGNIRRSQSAELAWEGRRRRKPLEKRFNLRLSLLSRLLLSFLIFTIYFSATAASVWVGFFHHRGSFRVSDEAAWYDFSSSFLLHSLNSPPIFPWIGWSPVVGVKMEEASASAKDLFFKSQREFMAFGFFNDVCARCSGVLAPSSPGRTVSAEAPWLLNEGSTLTFERADWRHEDTFLRLTETPVALMSASRQAFLFFPTGFSLQS